MFLGRIAVVISLASRPMGDINMNRDVKSMDVEISSVGSIHMIFSGQCDMTKDEQVEWR